MRVGMACFAFLWLCVIPLAASADKDKDKKDNKKPAPKTTPQPAPALDRKMDEWEASQRKLMVAQLRARFSTMDTSRDDFLDEAELAVAFRGKDAKPPMTSKESGTAPTKSGAEASKYPDREFLLALDDDRDQRISLAEYVEWAEDYALAYARSARNAEETRQRIVDLQLKMAQANSAAQRQAIENQLAQQRVAFAKQQADLKDRKDNPNKHRRDKKNKN